MAYCVYILKCADGSYYTGSTNDLGRRLREHQHGYATTAYTYRRRPISLAWSAEVQTSDEALLREFQIKAWPRIKKEALIRGDVPRVRAIGRNERPEKARKKRE
jgi:predicted GIY-YIG superfamily endonuclease